MTASLKNSPSSLSSSPAALELELEPHFESLSVPEQYEGDTETVLTSTDDTQESGVTDDGNFESIAPVIFTAGK